MRSQTSATSPPTILGLPHTGEKAAALSQQPRRHVHRRHSGAGPLESHSTPWECNYGDLDNDGWLDFYVAPAIPTLSTLIPNRMFRNDGGRRFQDVTTSGGFGHLQKGHGVSFADLDNDGDQDVHVVMGGAYSGDVARNALFLNPGHGNHWITLKLEGVTSNRAAIGARIRVVVATADGRALHLQDGRHGGELRSLARCARRSASGGDRDSRGGNLLAGDRADPKTDRLENGPILSGPRRQKCGGGVGFEKLPAPARQRQGTPAVHAPHGIANGMNQSGACRFGHNSWPGCSTRFRLRQTVSAPFMRPST